MKLPNLLKNITASAASQLGIYLANIATLPYLARTLGKDGLGQLVYLQSIMALVILFVDFGFSWSAIKIISTIRHDRSRISKEFFSIWTAQWILTILSGVILYLISQMTDLLHTSNRQLFFGYLTVTGYTLFPFWLLHGMENIRVSTIIQLISKLATIPIIFLVVREPTDIDMAILILASCNLLSGFLFIFYIIKANALDWNRPSIDKITMAYKNGWQIYFAKINISLPSLLIPIYLNTISGQASLGLYNVADKVKSAIISLTGPVATALFPRMSLLAHFKENEFIKLGTTAAFWQIILLTPLCCFAWFFASEIATLIGGSQFIDATSTIRYLAFLPLLTSTSNIVGMQIMLPIGMEKTFSIINFGSLILLTVIALKFIPYYQADGAAVALLLTEIFTLVITVYKIRNLLY